MQLVIEGGVDFDVLILGKSCINMGFITVNRRAFPIGLNINSYNYPLYKPSNKERPEWAWIKRR